MSSDALLEKLLIAGGITLCLLDLFLPLPYLFIVDVSLGFILVLAATGERSLCPSDNFATP
jgi:hypothetical protein